MSNQDYNTLAAYIKKLESDMQTNRKLIKKNNDLLIALLNSKANQFIAKYNESQEVADAVEDILNSLWKS